MAFEEPLGGVVARGFREAVGVFLSGDLLPVFEVKRDLNERGVGYFKVLVVAANGIVELGGLAEAPDGGEVGGIIWNNHRDVYVETMTVVSRDRQSSHG